MKFCKNLQRVVEISDPEWAPYWPNYKMLKKLIKVLPSLYDADKLKTVRAVKTKNESGGEDLMETTLNRDGRTTLTEKQHNNTNGDQPTISPSPNTSLSVKSINTSPGEVAFFKLLHSELKKACCFFQNAEQEFLLREERVKEGKIIMEKSNAIMMSSRWSLLAKSVYGLYKDLLLLETFAIMTYCSFSKILKKHDKITGFGTRNAFMTNVVNKANFSTYPDLLAMISRTEALYEEVSNQLMEEEKNCLREDERLFIDMINGLNKQTIEIECDPSVNRRSSVGTILNNIGSDTSSSSDDSDQVSKVVSQPTTPRESKECEGNNSTKRKVSIHEMTDIRKKTKKNGFDDDTKS